MLRIDRFMHTLARNKADLTCLTVSEPVFFKKSETELDDDPLAIGYIKTLPRHGHVKSVIPFNVFKE